MSGEIAMDVEPVVAGVPQAFLIGAEDFKEDQLAGALGPDFRVGFERAKAQDLTFFDTFEWGVWFREALLYESAGTFHLARLEGGWIGQELCAEEVREASPGFVWDFHNPCLRAELEQPLGLRRIVPIAEFRIVRRLAELSNASGKIVCRFELATLFPVNHPRSPFCRLCRILPLRGYEDQGARVRKALLASGCSVFAEGPMPSYLRRLGNSPRRYTIRPAFGLTPGLPAREAVLRIVRRMLDLVAENEPGIVRDQDTEFLHDYRICLRKIRSVITLIDGVFPAETTARLKKILSGLARATNRLRDLDVCLLARGEYAGHLPAALRPALEPMFADFEAERAVELAAVVRHLKSSPCRRRMRELAALFDKDCGLPPSQHSDAAVGPLVFKRIFKRYRKIRNVEGELGADTPDEAVHEVRIQGKKLRYLMEFFSELLPAGDSAPLEKGLRRLQNRLGNFNDFSVHQKFFLEYWSRKKDEPGLASELPLALGGLITALYLRQQEQRKDIQSALAAFCGREVSGAFKRTFKPVIPPAPAGPPAEAA